MAVSSVSSTQACGLPHCSVSHIILTGPKNVFTVKYNYTKVKQEKASWLDGFLYISLLIVTLLGPAVYVCGCVS